MINYDTAVIGGGASGLAAAISAARHNPGLKIVILERLPRIGKKILATGNGRCNYTNTNIDKTNYFGSCQALYNSIKDFDCEAFFRSLGVYGYCDEEFRVYPMNNSASAVLDGLRLEIMRLNIEVICDFNVTDIKKDRFFKIYSDSECITAKTVIAAGGGMSQSNLGSDGSVLRIMKKAGIKISPLSPALTAFRVNPDAVRSLKGIRTSGTATLYSGNKKIGSENGEIQFSDGIISGICIFNLSCLAAGKENLSVSIDMMPHINYNERKDMLTSIREIRKNAPLEDLLSGIINKRIGMNIIKNNTSHALTEKASVLTDKELTAIASAIKDYRFDITGLCGFEKSQVTAGGIDISEVKPDLSSKKFQGMYFCGEMLDIIGLCGGFNLYFAFASGYMAGKNCAEGLNDKN